MQGGSATPLAALTLLSDNLISLAGCAIAVALLFFLRKRRQERQRWLLGLLALCIAAGSAIHFLSAWGLWQPSLALGAYFKLLAAPVLLLAAGGLWLLVLRPSGVSGQTLSQLRRMIRQLEHEVAERRRAEEALEHSRELLRQLAAYQERVKEDERKRIAREIHDDLGQNLMALRIDVSLLQARTRQNHPLLNRKVSQALEHIDATIKAVRAVISNLRPTVLDLGLYAAIEWQVKEFERRTGIACELQHEAGQADFEMDDDRATAFFRILQESLTNVARHAQASRVRIRLQRQGRQFCMSIQDDGVGMFAGCRRKPNSFGLLGIEERVSSLGGIFQVDEAPARGTRLSISIPIEAGLPEEAAMPPAARSPAAPAEGNRRTG